MSLARSVPTRRCLRPLGLAAVLLAHALRLTDAARAEERANAVPLKNWGGFSLDRDAFYDDLERLVAAGLTDPTLLKHKCYALPAFPALALLVGAAWASGPDIGRWLRVGLVGCVLVGAWAIWIGAGLTPDQAMTGFAELNVYYRILREQGVPFPFPSARPFGWLLETLGVTLIAGWGLATLGWARGWRRSSFVTLLAVAAVITGLILHLLDLVEPHHSAKAISQAITARAGPADVIVVEGSLEYSPALPFYTWVTSRSPRSCRRPTACSSTRGT